MKKVLFGGELLNEEEKLDLQVIINNSPADGKIKNRIINKLEYLVRY